MGAPGKDSYEPKESEKTLKIFKKKFASLKKLLTFAIPFASRMGFFDKIIDKIEGSTSKYREQRIIESVDFLGMKAVGVELRII